MNKHDQPPPCAYCEANSISHFFGDMSAAERSSMLRHTEIEWFAKADPRELTPVALSNRMYNTQQIIELLHRLEMTFPPKIKTP